MNPFKHDPSTNPLKELRISRYFNYLKSHRVFIFSSLIVFLVITAYVWFISFGSWSKWSVISIYYDQLATAFEHGSLSLEIKPNPALLALPDPYDPSARAGLNYPKDVSLYKGKYYLYFGPVPALILSIFKRMGLLIKFGDQDIVFVFVSGMFVFQALLILKIWERFFQNVPVWILLMCILFSGLISPFTWILTQARIYEAAAAAGQFFFLAGFYFITVALEQKFAAKKNFFFFIGGISWTLAIGSRLTQILPIGFVTLIIAYLTIRTYRQTKEWSKAIFAMELLGGPLVLGIAVLARYNWARFHSVFETGLSYQLAGSADLQRYSHFLFSPLYILPNLYGYLTMPPQFNRTFPFLESVPGTGAFIFSFITLPNIYYNNILTGLLFSTPFVLFAGICITSLVLKKKNLMSLADQTNDYLFKWLIASLLGSFVFGFVPFVSFFWVASHYQTDYVPSIVMLSIIGFWQGYGFLTHKPPIRKLYVGAGIILMITSIIISILLVLSAHTAQFQKFNPVLWNCLIGLFSR
jgi:hypothetical protein